MNTRQIFSLIIVIQLTTPLYTQVLSENFKSLPTPIMSNDYDYYGSEVSVFENFAVISSRANNGIGCAFILHKTADSWDIIAKLTPSNGNTGDGFGSSVCINNNLVVIGAAVRNNREGAAYVFEKPEDGWRDMTETAILTASNGIEGDYFGNAVSCSEDIIIVGAYGNNDEFGAVYLYSKPSQGWNNMTENAILSAAEYDYHLNFGYSVSIDKDIIVVGAIGYLVSEGSAYVFSKPEGGWISTTETAKLLASDRAREDYFGTSVGISGNTIAIGAPRDDDNGSGSGSAYIFEKPLGGWTSMNETAKLNASDGNTNDRFGDCIGISDNTIVVGARDNEEKGAVYVFEKLGDSWENMNETEKIIAPDATLDDFFGESVSLSGEALVIGAFGNDDQGEYSGSAYLFEKEVDGWKCNEDYGKSLPMPHINGTDSFFGSNIAVDGNYAVVLSEFRDTGSAFVLEFGGSSWEIIAKLTSSTDDMEPIAYHESVAIHDDLIAIGDNDDKIVYLFERPENGWRDMTETITLTPSNPEANNRFGRSVRIDNRVVVVGCPRCKDREGALYVYELPETTISNMTETAILTASDGAYNDELGHRVSIINSVIAASSPGDNMDQGSLYIYEKPSTGWTNMTQSVKFNNYFGTDDDNFGSSIGLSENLLVVGADEDDDMGNNAGAVWLVEKPNNGWSNAEKWIKLTSSNAADFCFFGQSVSVYGDDFVVGAPKTEKGSAYYFKKLSESSWKETELVASDGEIGDRFGESVSISGNSIVVGAPDSDDYGKNTGSVYLFLRNGANSIENSFYRDYFRIYPNPAKSHIYYNRSDIEIHNIIILDIMGKVVMRIQEVSPEKGITIADLENGAYILEFHTTDGIVSRTFVKE